MVLKANDRRTSSPCHDEFRGPRSDCVRQSVGGASPAVLCLSPNSIDSLRQMAVETEILYITAPRKPYGGAINGHVSLGHWDYAPGYIFLTTGRHSYHSSTLRPTCAKE
ncbi:hypothetical protein TNCV_1885471 [Trichonephila clavipes]|nr:hypothetical protein TNCV_1885471 [Trichonephila clavipes]